MLIIIYWTQELCFFHFGGNVRNPTDMPQVGSPSTVLSTCKLATRSFQVSRAVADILRTRHTKPWGSYTRPTETVTGWWLPKITGKHRRARRHINRSGVIPTWAHMQYCPIVKVHSLGSRSANVWGGAHCARVEVCMENTSKKHVNYSFGNYILI